MTNTGNEYGYLRPNCDRGTDLLVKAMAALLLTPQGMEIDDAKLLDTSHA
jgi:hypothetical protein